MKQINIIYWISTVIAAALMVFSSYGDVLMLKEAVDFMHMLGYPDYFTRFIGIAKLAGVAGILLPIPPRLKEWAYAGLFFDLFGAVYSGIAVFGFNPQMLMMLIWIVPPIISYVYYHKKLKAAALKAAP